MYKQVEFEIKGVSPLLMHSGLRLTNPADPLTKALKSFTSKRTKTEDDHIAMSKIEWLAGIYWKDAPKGKIVGTDIEIIGGSNPVIPGDCLEGCLVNGAKKNKLGTLFKSGMLVFDSFELQYEGLKTAAEMWEDGSFVDVRAVAVQRNKIMRTRGIFHDWALTFTVNYLPDVLNMDQIVEAVEISGKMIGLCDYRPKYGRFEMVGYSAI
jgi:hypothetical protein